MTMTLTALLFASSLLSVIATLLYTWREQGDQVLALAGRMRGSRPVGRMYHVVRVPAAREAVSRRAVPVRLTDLQRAVG